MKLCAGCILRLYNISFSGYIMFRRWVPHLLKVDQKRDYEIYSKVTLWVLHWTSQVFRLPIRLSLNNSPNSELCYSFYSFVLIPVFQYEKILDGTRFYSNEVVIAETITYFVKLDRSYSVRRDQQNGVAFENHSTR